MPGYPIELELAGRPVLVVGLGAVGSRKVAGLVEAGAQVVGVDPSGAGPGMPEGVVVRPEPYRAEHLRGMALAFAAATAEVNARVVADARRMGIWVNAAGGPEPGDFRVPAIWRDGPLLVAVSTGGASPALAARLRDRVAEALGSAAGGLASVLAELRPIALARLDDPEARRRLLADWADPARLHLWATEGPEAVRLALLEALREAEAGGRGPDPAP